MADHNFKVHVNGPITVMATGKLKARRIYSSSSVYNFGEWVAFRTYLLGSAIRTIGGTYTSSVIVEAEKLFSLSNLTIIGQLSSEPEGQQLEVVMPNGQYFELITARQQSVLNMTVRNGFFTLGSPSGTKLGLYADITIIRPANNEPVNIRNGTSIQAVDGNFQILLHIF